jgi:hypothetical protein
MYEFELSNQQLDPVSSETALGLLVSFGVSRAFCASCMDLLILHSRSNGGKKVCAAMITHADLLCCGKLSSHCLIADMEYDESFVKHKKIVTKPYLLVPTTTNHVRRHS